MLLFSFQKEKELERYHVLNSSYMALWGDVLYDTLVKWDSVTLGEGLAHGISAKFSATH